MGTYKYIAETFQNEYKERNNDLKGRVILWRKESSINRVDKPTNVARARKLGYKAKQGVVIYRVRVTKGLRRRKEPIRGRKPSKTGRYYAFRKSLQSMAEERAAGKAANCEVLNSYYVGEDGEYKFFEVILLDRSNKSIINDKEYKNIINHKGRAYRGLSSSGKKHRGLNISTGIRARYRK
jgi:large subunit ribosomal protein L15e